MKIEIGIKKILLGKLVETARFQKQISFQNEWYAEDVQGKITFRSLGFNAKNFKQSLLRSPN